MDLTSETPEEPLAPTSSTASVDAGRHPLPLPPPGEGRDGGESTSPLKTWGWVSVGIGGALLVGGGITGGLALGKNGDVEKACEGGVCYEDDYGLLDSRDGLATASTVLMISGGALAATGIVLLIAGRDGETEDGSVALLPGPGGFVLEGRF